MKILITGINGQDGSYLAELLLEQGHEVVGIIRRSSTNTKERIKHLLNKISLLEGDVTDPGFIYKTVLEEKPKIIYNLAAQSHVWTSFQQPTLTTNATYLGCLNILEAIRIIDPKIKFYQASSSEMFGKNYSLREGVKYQDENTPFVPQSPYSIAKLAAHHLTRLYRESYGIFACSGILFNHESPRRGEEFVTRKITKWIGNYYKWKQGTLALGETKEEFNQDYILSNGFSFPKLRLGNLSAMRDYGHAKDYVKAMTLMMKQEQPDDYVVSTEETHTIEEFLSKTFSFIGIENYHNYVVIDPKFYRPAEVDYLLGLSTKIRNLGWEPEYEFESLVREMVLEDIKL
jgi:GDPmannose 4,6-dehydratase